MISNWESLFGDFDKRLWLNTADQGPMPLAAARAAAEALEWKVYPARQKIEQYQSVPARLRELLHLLIGASGGQVILGNSASYGLSIIARALRRGRAKNHVLLVEDDFPANFSAWRGSSATLEIKLIQSERWSIDPYDALTNSLQPATRIFCLSWVESFTGRALDLKRIGDICRSNGTFVVANVSQGLGNRVFDVATFPIDALTCSGSKWLCGPYGTGFSWVNDELLASMRPVQYYWQANKGEASLAGMPISKRADSPYYDHFATANFLNSVPWISALECILGIGTSSIATHVDKWIDSFKVRFDVPGCKIISHQANSLSSALVFVSHEDAANNLKIIEDLTKNGVDAALRRDKIRFSPHLFNPVQSADIALDALRSATKRIR